MVSKKNVYLQMMVAYNYATVDEVKRFSSGQDTFIKAKSLKRAEEYNLEANLRHGRYMIARDNAMKSEFVYVVPHYGSRPQHVHLQGQIFSREEFENSVEYPNNPDGIGCINCRHEIRPYKSSSDLDFVPPDIDDPVFYENEQKMRAIERKVREYKLEGNDDKVKEWYSRMMTFSETHNTPIQLNRTWIIDQDLSKVLKVTNDIDTDLYTIIKDRQKNGTWYSVALPKYNLSQVNLLPSVTNQTIDIGGDIKLATKYKGGFKQYLINGQNISQINMIPHNVRTSYTGRPYGFGKAVVDEKSFTDMLKKRLEGKAMLSVHSHGSVKFEELTTELVLNASGVFYIPPNTAVSTYDPTEIYNNFKQYEVDKVTDSSYGIYKDNNGVFKFFYGDNVPSEAVEIFDYSRVPNKQKLNNNLLNTPVVKQPKDLSVKIDENRQKSKWFEHLEGRLDNAHVEKISYKMLRDDIGEKAIVRKIADGDLTSGSCHSQAITYIANKYGRLDTLDFRGGNSMVIMREEYEGFYNDQISKGAKVYKSTIKRVEDQLKDLYDHIEYGKEYMMSWSRHSAIVKKTEHGYLNFLELQDHYLYGWCDDVERYESTINKIIEMGEYEEFRKNNNPFDRIESLFKNRFGFINSGGYGVHPCLLDLDTIVIDDDFKKMMEYINTNKKDAKKGIKGGIK